jgi:hypothetical protein
MDIPREAYRVTIAAARADLDTFRHAVCTYVCPRCGARVYAIRPAPRPDCPQGCNTRLALSAGMPQDGLDPEAWLIAHLRMLREALRTLDQSLDTRDLTELGAGHAQASASPSA